MSHTEAVEVNISRHLGHLVPFRHFAPRDIRQDFIHLLEQHLLIDASGEVPQGM